MTDDNKTATNNLQDESTRVRICKEATILFSKKGYHATSIDDITRSAGISKGAFYWHFKSKDELLQRILEEWEHRFLDGLIHAVSEVKGGAFEKFEKMNRYTSAFAVRNRALCVSFDTLSGELVEAGHRMKAEFRRIYARYQDFLFNLIEKAKREKIFRPELDSRLAALIIMSFHHGLLLQWSMNREVLDGAAFMFTYQSILYEGILVRNK